MEVWNILTYRDYDFTDDKTGRQIKGRSVHCYRKNNDGWPGVEYAKFGINSSSPAYAVVPVLGGSYELMFDRFGKVSSMNKV